MVTDDDKDEEEEEEEDDEKETKRYKIVIFPSTRVESCSGGLV